MFPKDPPRPPQRRSSLSDREKQSLHGEGEIYRAVNNDWDINSYYFERPRGSSQVLLGLNHPYDPKLHQRFKQDPSKSGVVWNLAGKRGHGLCFCTTGGGKNTNLIMPALLGYGGSVLCLDPKGENAWVTGQRRRQLGQRVVILDPWGEVNKRYGSKVGVAEQVGHFNPLSSLDPRSEDFNDDVTAIADGVIITPERADPHWTDSAGLLVAGMIAACVERSPGLTSFKDLRRLLTASDAELQQAILDICARNPNGVAARKLQRFTKSSNEISSIRSTANTQLAIFDSARLLSSMETRANDPNTLDLADLARGFVSLYIVLPVDKLQTHGRWMRLVLQLALKAIARVPTPPPVPVLFMLDELGTINPGGGLRMIEQAYGLLGSQGVRIWGFFQNLDQLQRDYPSTWQTFIANSEAVQLMKVNDVNTAEYFSRHIGSKTVYEETSQFGRAWETHSMQSRPLLLPQEIRKIPDNEVLTMFNGGNEFLLPTVAYFNEPRWNHKYRPNPLYPLPAWAVKGAAASFKPKPVSQPQSSAGNLETALSKGAGIVSNWWKAAAAATRQQIEAETRAADEKAASDALRASREAESMSERARYLKMIRDAE